MLCKVACLRVSSRVCIEYQAEKAAIEQTEKAACAVSTLQPDKSVDRAFFDVLHYFPVGLLIGSVDEILGCLICWFYY